MDMNRLSKQNSIEKKMIELEKAKQKLYELGLDDEDRFQKYLELDDKIDELMMEHGMI